MSTDREVLQQIKSLVDAQLGAVTPPPGETRTQMVERLYREELHMEPDSGVAHWVNSGWDEAAIRVEFRAAYARTHQTPPATPSTSSPHTMQWAEFREMGIPTLVRAYSGQITCMRLPATGIASGVVVLTETPAANSPSQGVVEISIGKTPGVIDTDYTNFCNFRAINGLNASVEWLAKPHKTINGDNAKTYGLCWAGDPGVQYFVNLRWTYTETPYGPPPGGYSVQYNRGGYT